MALTCPNGCDEGFRYQAEATIFREVLRNEDGSVFVRPNPPYEVEEILEIEAKFVCCKCGRGIPASEITFEWVAI